MVGIVLALVVDVMASRDAARVASRLVGAPGGQGCKNETSARAWPGPGCGTQWKSQRAFELQ
jgi:hypothetical protein